MSDIEARPDGRGMLLVVAGPSGVGKGTVIEGLRARHCAIEFSVSVTTRPPRPGEVEGVDYRFVSEAEFLRMRREGELLEWALVHGSWHYGTLRRPVAEALDEGRDIVLEIDYQGARSVRAALPEAVLVFVAPPSIEALVERLRGRNTETPETIRRRLRSAHAELRYMGMFHYVIVNDVLTQAVEALESVYLAERCSLPRAGWRSLQRSLLAELESEV